jgi:ribosomal RNA-processing protein 1
MALWLLQVSWMYYATFMHTMRREWAGIDRLRLDKFMLLIRKFVAAVLRQLQTHSW